MNQHDSQNDKLAAIYRIQSIYQDTLMSKPNVIGVAVGLVKRNGQYTHQVGVIVLVRRKIPAHLLSADEIIPGEIEGVIVDVQETEEINLQS